MNLNKETSKVLSSMIFEIYCYNFFSKHQGLLNDLQKQTTRSFSSINFIYTNRLHFFLVITVHVKKIDLIKITSSKNLG